MTKTILIVDDEPMQLRLIEHVIKDKLLYRTVTAAGGQEAIDHVLTGKDPQPDLILLDLNMPRINGMDVIRAVRAVRPALPIIILTLHGDVEKAVTAIKLGANDFLVKPAPVERLRISIQNTLNLSALQQQVTKLSRTAAVGAVHFADMVGSSEALKNAVTMAQKAATSNISVFINGESGVGKEFFARAIHCGSERHSRPFVAVNCGAIPENLLESELFGHEKGAFTGAISSSLGKIREAEGGTLFLDEVGELRKELQVKLLRALQEGEIEPVGGKKPVKVNFRLISATNRNLQERVRAGEFREDLYYRINVFPVEVPSLKERRGDIPQLVQHFIEKFAVQEARPVRGISSDALELLISAPWPGNIRQLQNAIFRAVVLCDGVELTLSDFKQLAGEVGVINPFPSMVLPMLDSANCLKRGLISITDSSGNVRKLSEVECEMIQFALHHYSNHMSEVARKLGIGRSTLYRKIADFNIAPGLLVAGDDAEDQVATA